MFYIVLLYYSAQKKICDPVVPIRVVLQSYESKMTDKRGQYDWRAEKNLDAKGEGGKNRLIINPIDA